MNKNMNRNAENWDRVKLIQYFINKYKYSIYLEIGTQKGNSFFPIICAKKIAVDPCFQIKLKDKIKWCFKNSINFNNRFFQMISDDFFKKENYYLKKLGFLDIVLIDGLHTFRGSLNDVLNSIQYLSESGRIIIHDCFPPHKAASIYAKDSDEAVLKGLKMKGWTGEWCGDTWKTIVYLREKYKEILEVLVLDTDYGLGVIKTNNANNVDLTIDEELFNRINELKYEDLIKEPEKLIGLTPTSFYSEI